MKIFKPLSPDTIERVERDGVRPLALDLFYPNTVMDEDLPVVLFIHGGGWSGGSRQQFYWHARDVSAKGFLGVCAEYRLSGEALFPAALNDCFAAVEYLRSNAEKLGLHADRIAAVGSSAGGHLAGARGIRSARTAQAPVKAVVAIHGIYDLPAMGATKSASICTSFIGSSLGDSPDTWIAASPLLQIDSSSNVAGSFFILHDPDDETVPYSQSQELAKRLIENGRNVCFRSTPGSGHGFIYNRNNPHTEKTWPVILRWLAENL